MRLTGFILGLLILFLSCLPCADVVAMHSPTAETETSKYPEQHEQHQGKDLCSPFCHCSCCSTYSVVNIPLLIPIIIAQPTCLLYVAHVPEAIIEISLPVWQPPQLV